MLLPSVPGSAPAAPRQTSALKILALVGLLIVVVYATEREKVTELFRRFTAPPPAVAISQEQWWGVWFARTGGDTYELPVIELYKAPGAPGGRIITPGVGRTHADVGLSLQEVTLNEDGLAFVTTAADRTRTVYRLVRTSADTADLFVCADTGQTLKKYLDGNDRETTELSPVQREKLLRELNAPQPNECVAHLKRLPPGLVPKTPIVVKPEPAAKSAPGKAR